MVARRNVLKLIGGGVVLAAGAGTGFVAMSGPSVAAREPWRRAGTYGEFRRQALSYALLAPNPHNRQPWLVRLEGEDALTLYCDLDRRLPVTDPFDRQITIGCGAFLELLVMAAARDGYRAVVTPFPEGDNMTSLDRRPVARVQFSKGEAMADPLFTQVLDRRSNKETYEPRDVPADLLQQLADAGRAFGMTSTAIGNTDLAEKLRDLTWRAHRTEMTTPTALRESIDLMRIGAAEVTANPDGLRLEGPMIEAGRLLGFVNRESLLDQNSTGFRQGLEKYRNMALSARAFGWLCNDNRSRSDQIDGGRAYVRLNLKATELGLAVHPWSQALQEYAEVEGLYREVHDLLGQGRRLQMLFRIGYAPKVIPTPRRGLNAHLA